MAQSLALKTVRLIERAGGAGTPGVRRHWFSWDIVNAVGQRPAVELWAKVKVTHTAPVGYFSIWDH